MYYYHFEGNYIELWYGLMRSASENLSNSDFYTKIRLFSDQFWPKSLNSDFWRKRGPVWEAWVSLDKETIVERKNRTGKNKKGKN